MKTGTLSEKKLMQSIKIGLGLDFRTHAYLENNYGCTPVFTYGFAENCVKKVKSFLKDFVEENKFDFPEFEFSEYNLGMEIERLRTETLKTYISGLLGQLFNYYVPRVFEIVSSSYDSDIGGIVTVSLNDEESDFVVQLTGGEYSSQMGCWIIHETQDGDFGFDDTAFADYAGDIITAGEESYETWVQEQMDEEVEEGEVFKFYDLKECRNCSATSSSQITVEKSNNGRFRSYLEGSGFTQPNDYSTKPDFKGPIYYDNEEDYLNNNTDDSLIEDN